MIPLLIEGKANLIEQACLMDTGAGANFISVTFAENLIRRKFVSKQDIIQLPSPITITYGNSTTEKADCAVPIQVKTSADDPQLFELLFVVTPNSSYSMILGRTGLKQLGLINLEPKFTPGSPRSRVIGSIAHSACAANVPLTDACGRSSRSVCEIQSCIASFSLTAEVPCAGSPTIERPPLVVVTTENRIQVNHSLLETAVVLPYRAPRRGRTGIDISIIKLKLEQMERQGKVERTDSYRCHMVHEVVLVDKLADQHIPRTTPTNEKELKRFRITLDIRSGNDLELVKVDEDESFALLPNKLASKVKRTKAPSYQCQFGSLEILQHLPADCDTFGKIDLDDAYSSVLIPENLRPLFCYCLPGPEPAYYRWCCLIQGWRYSPLLFSIAIEFMLDKCRPRMPPGIHLRHFQDDILIAGRGPEAVKPAMTTVISIFTSFGFVINEAKTQLSSGTVFCGYKISASGITPFPKSPVTADLFRTVWSQFENAKSVDIRLNLLRQWSGRFNYFLGFLPPDQLSYLRVIYNSISILMKNPSTFSEKHVALTRESLFNLCSFVVDGHIPIFTYGVIKNTIFSIVCTDANVDSYSGILLRLSVVDYDVIADDVADALIEAIKSAIPLQHDSRRLILTPVRVYGHRFSTSEMKQSSTFKERYALLSCVNEFYSLLEGEVICLSDNQNTTKSWHNLDESLSYGKNLVPWMRFNSAVKYSIWVPRNVIDFVDKLARCLAPPKTAVKISQNSVSISPTPITVPAPTTEAPPSSATEAPARLPELTLPLRKAIEQHYVDDKTLYLNVRMNEIYDFLSHGNSQHSQSTKRLATRFFLQNGLLYHSRVTGPPQIYVPAGGLVSVDNLSKGTIRANILFANHDMFCHRGFQKLAHEISLTFWWPSLLGDCLLYCKSCSRCQLVKLRFSKFKGQLSGISSDRSSENPISLPLKSWVVDYAGPLGSSDDHYVLVCVCTFSSYAVLIETDDCTAATTARELFRRIVCLFGIPEQVYSDRGSHFNSETISRLNELLGIHWRISSSYNPRSQGTAERLVSHMKQSLELLDFKISQLPLIQFYHNSSLIGDSLLTPHEIIYGVRPNTSALIQQNSFEFECDDISMLVIETRITWESFKRYMRDRQSDVYSVKADPIEFVPGDQVYRVYVTSNALKRTVRTGPYTVISKAGRNTYVLQGIQYPIPEYQLHLVAPRPDELSLFPNVVPSCGTASTPPIAISDCKIGNLIIFETSETFDGSTISFDVGEIIEIYPDHDRLQILRYYFQTNGEWRKWPEPDPPIDISIQQVIRSDIRLYNHKLPKRIVAELLEMN